MTFIVKNSLQFAIIGPKVCEIFFFGSLRNRDISVQDPNAVRLAWMVSSYVPVYIVSEL